MESFLHQLEMIANLEQATMKNLQNLLKRELGAVLGIRDSDMISDIGYIYDDCGFVDYYAVHEDYKLYRVMFPKSLFNNCRGVDIRSISRQELSTDKEKIQSYIKERTAEVEELYTQRSQLGIGTKHANLRSYLDEQIGKYEFLLLHLGNVLK